MLFENREAARKQSCLKLQEVTELGDCSGHWSILSISKPEGTDTWRFATIKTPAGLVFDLSGGSWNHENKIHARVGTVRAPGNITVTVRDVIGFRESSPPDAYVSAEKPAAQILKDILRRVITNPDCVATAQKMADRLATLSAGRSDLRAHIKSMVALGFTFRDTENETYSTSAYHAKLHGTKVYNTGRVSVELTCSIADLPAIIAIVSKAGVPCTCTNCKTEIKG